MTDVEPYNNNTLANQNNGGGDIMTQQANQRVMSEIQSRMIVAKKMPRDEMEAIQRIKRSCKRPKLAESARYSYPRGGTRVTGPSIRLAEAIAQQWQNLDFGFKELDQRVGEDGIKESVVEAYAWDLETNVRQTKTFTVKHVRDTKQGTKQLTSQRDIYEMVANQGARRLRSCILAIIPQDVIDTALDECKKTIQGNNKKPLEDRLQDMLEAFEKFSVSKAMIEDRLGHNLEATDETELVSLIDIYNSLKDGMSERTDWFDVNAGKGKANKDKESVADAVTGSDSDDDEGDIETADPSKRTIKKYKRLASKYYNKEQRSELVNLLSGDSIPKEPWEEMKKELRDLKKEAEEESDDS